MLNLLTIIYNNYIHVIKISFLNYFKTGNVYLDTLLPTFFLSIFGVIVNYMYENEYDKKILNFKFDHLFFYFYKKNNIILEGKRCSTTSTYSNFLSVSSLYSDRFKAFFNFIILNIDNITDIYQIKEAHTNFQSSETCEDRRKNLDIFMVNQSRPFKIDQDIYVKVDTEQEETRDDKEKMNSKIDKITIEIYSYKYSISYLINYIDDITNKYKLSVKNIRSNQRFIYNLEKVKNENEDNKFDCWKEQLFESTRSFNNIFFDGKIELIQKIDFFINNRNWYYEKGIPYSLGIGLHGPPGTGKTSFIKALANYTNRHLIVISLKLIKTKRQLDNFFFENTYNDNNEKKSITFDKKIIVFEDIDCIGDIVLERTLKKTKKQNVYSKNYKDNLNIGDIFQSIQDINNNNMITSTKECTVMNSTIDPPITLDDLLNLWDGIRETPGRILIISSNFYSKLDNALIRPGRIDITHELKNCSHQTIEEIYKHLFGKIPDCKKLKKIKEYFYSPAELINLYVSNKNENDFINRLIENKK
jgi:ATP-dependent 26S proteasome regulatory subunit